MKVLNNGNTLADLNNATTAKIKRVINGQYTLSLEAYEKELKSIFFNTENYIEADNKYFDIVYIQNIHAGSIKYKIECEHVSYRLIEKKYNAGHSITGTPRAIVEELVNGTDFSVGEVSEGSSMTISIDESTNAYAILIKLANELYWEVDYEGFSVSLINEIGINNGYEVRFGKNLKSITKHIDRRDGVLKTYYSINVLELKKSKKYKDLGYESLEVIEIGDTILINDELMNLSVEQRIVSIEYDVLRRRNTRLEITNKIELIADRIVAINNDIKENKALIKANDGKILLLTEDVDGNKSLLQIQADQISTLVEGVSGNYSSIEQNAEKIETNVNGIEGNSTSIQQNTDQIGLNVTGIANNSANIGVAANEIALKVSKDGVISAINLTSEEAKIAANKINLVGYVTITNLQDGSTIISGDNIKTGTIEAARLATDIAKVNDILQLGSQDSYGEIKFRNGLAIKTNGEFGFIIDGAAINLPASVSADGFPLVRERDAVMTMSFDEKIDLHVPSSTSALEVYKNYSKKGEICLTTASGVTASGITITYDATGFYIAHTGQGKSKRFTWD